MPSVHAFANMADDEDNNENETFENAISLLRQAESLLSATARRPGNNDTPQVIVSSSNQTNASNRSVENLQNRSLANFRALFARYPASTGSRSRSATQAPPKRGQMVRL